MFLFNAMLGLFHWLRVGDFDGVVFECLLNRVFPENLWMDDNGFKWNAMSVRSGCGWVVQWLRRLCLMNMSRVSKNHFVESTAFHVGDLAGFSN